jgi:hypothetical protein
VANRWFSTHGGRTRGGGPGRPKGPGSTSGSNAYPYVPGAWATFTATLADSRIECLVDAGPIYLDLHKNDLTKSRSYQVRAGDQDLDVKSFTVKPLKP